MFYNTKRWDYYEYFATEMVNDVCFTLSTFWNNFPQLSSVAPYIYDKRWYDSSANPLPPCEAIFLLYSTSDNKVFRIELSTERKNDLLLKPKSCLATLTKDGDEFVIKKQKAPFKGRLNLNLSRLLPGFWKVVSMGISQQNNNTVQVPVGMIKIYPSYDGNGSSRRKVRYL